jgi:hypothetical protein
MGHRMRVLGPRRETTSVTINSNYASCPKKVEETE